MRVQHISDGFQWGLYLAKSNDKYIKNEDGDYLNIASQKNDAQKIKKLIQAAKSFGLDNITVEFREGAMQLSDEEYEEQRTAMESGLILPQYDPGAFK